MRISFAQANLYILLTFCFTMTAHAARPNFVLFIADDQNIWDYGCYGNDKVNTPAVDRLAQEGMRFTRNYTPQAICAPARSVLFSGNYPVKNGAYLNHTQLRDGQTSLISDLKRLGYKVILAGKSHVGPRSAFPWSEWWRSEEAVVDDGGQTKRLPMKKVRQFLENEEGPYCLVLASDLPHSPHPKVENVSEDDVKLLPYHGGATKHRVEKVAGYYENIRRDDSQFEEVLEAIDRSPRPENTLVLYTADHGSDGKFTVYDRGLNVAMVLRWPAVVEEASVSDALISLADVFPTFIELAGGDAPRGVDGKSFAHVLKDPSAKALDYTYGLSQQQNIWIPSVFPSRMVTDGRWKYIRNFNAYEVHEQNFGDHEGVNGFIRAGAKKQQNVPYEELYDLESDPFEQDNLIRDPHLTNVKHRLVTQLFRWMEEQGDYLAEGGPMPLLQPEMFFLDQKNRLYTPPEGLEGALEGYEFRPR